MKEIKIENIVATTTLADDLDLNAIQSLFKDAEYDAERFPGLVYHMKSPKTATLLFSTGKAVCTGAKDPSDVMKAIDILSKELSGVGYGSE